MPELKGGVRVQSQVWVASNPVLLDMVQLLPQEPAEEVLPQDPYPVFAAETLGEDIVTLLNLPI